MPFTQTTLNAIETAGGGAGEIEVQPTYTRDAPKYRAAYRRNGGSVDSTGYGATQGAALDALLSELRGERGDTATRIAALDAEIAEVQQRLDNLTARRDAL